MIFPPAYLFDIELTQILGRILLVRSFGAY